MTENKVQPIRVLIVDDHEVVREGLQTLLAEEAAIELVGQAADGREAVTMAKTERPDVILMDLVMPHLDGIEATRQILAADPDSKVLILTSFAEDKRVHDAIQAGATGYLLKDTLRPELVRAILAAAEGKATLHPEAQQALIRQATAPKTAAPHDNLTARECDVLALIGRGNSNREIAATLHLTEGTVKGYVSNILSKLDVADRTQAALYAVKHGLADPNH
jgi:NarL family two-component system response regulator LiaR